MLEQQPWINISFLALLEEVPLMVMLHQCPVLCKRQKKSPTLTQQTGARPCQYRHFGFKSHFWGSTGLYSGKISFPSWKSSHILESIHISQKSHTVVSSTEISFLTPCGNCILYTKGAAHHPSEGKGTFFPLEGGIWIPIYKEKLKDFSLFLRFISKSLKVSLVL